MRNRLDGCNLETSSGAIASRILVGLPKTSECADCRQQRWKRPRAEQIIRYLRVAEAICTMGKHGGCSLREGGTRYNNRNGNGGCSRISNSGCGGTGRHVGQTRISNARERRTREDVVTSGEQNKDEKGLRLGRGGGKRMVYLDAAKRVYNVSENRVIPRATRHTPHATHRECQGYILLSSSAGSQP